MTAALKPFLEDRAARVAPRLFSAEPVPCSAFQGFDDLTEHEHTLYQLFRASSEVYAATLAIDVLPSTNRIARASTMLADAYRLIEDAEGLVRADNRMEPI